MIGRQQALNHYRQNQYGIGAEDMSQVERLQLLFHGLADILCRCEGCMASGQLARRGELIGQSMDIFITLKQGLVTPTAHTPIARQVSAMADQLNELYDHCLFLLSRTTLENDLDALRVVRYVVKEMSEAWAGVTALQMDK